MEANEAAKEELIRAVQPLVGAEPAGCAHPGNCALRKARGYSMDGHTFPASCFFMCRIPGALNDPARK